MEKTLVLCKPDAVQRRLVGEIVGRMERRGLRLVAMKFLHLTPEQAAEVYSPHQGRAFYKPLVAFMTAGPIVAMVWEGVGAIPVVRAMMGPTLGRVAPPGTIRGDFGLSQRYNLVHGSDSPESASREIPLFFEADELIEYDLDEEKWIHTTVDRGGE